MAFIMHLCQSFTILVLLSIASCLPWDGPEPTPVHNALLRAKDCPTPTPGPHGFRKQWKRQGSTSISSSMSSIPPDPVCGYISGSTSNSLVCPATYSGNECAYDSQYNVWGCCQSPYTACELATSCIPYSSQSICGSDCAANPYLTVCSDPTLPLCNQYVLDDSGILASNFWCGATTETDTLSLFATDGSQNFVTFVEVTMNILVKTSSSTSSSSIPSPTTSTSSSLPSTTVLPTTTSSPTPTHTSSPSSTPVGAIAGGAVGGVAVIGAIIVAIILILRKKRTPKSTPAPTPAPTYPDSSTAPELYSPHVPAYDNRSSTFKSPVVMSEPMRAMPMYPSGGGQGLGVGATEMHGHGHGGGLGGGY